MLPPRPPPFSWALRSWVVPASANLKLGERTSEIYSACNFALIELHLPSVLSLFFFIKFALISFFPVPHSFVSSSTISTTASSSFGRVGQKPDEWTLEQASKKKKVSRENQETTISDTCNPRLGGQGWKVKKMMIVVTTWGPLDWSVEGERRAAIVELEIAWRGSFFFHPGEGGTGWDGKFVEKMSKWWKVKQSSGEMVQDCCNLKRMFFFAFEDVHFT